VEYHRSETVVGRFSWTFCVSKEKVRRVGRFCHGHLSIDRIESIIFLDLGWYGTGTGTSIPIIDYP
jgi:hypothetical protein